MRLSILFIVVLSLFALSSAICDSRAQSKSDPSSLTTIHDLGILDLSRVMERAFPSPANYTFRAETDSEGLCKVHHERLKRVTVPIVYGITAAFPYSKNAERNSFPNAIVRIDGGCTPHGPKEAIVLLCEKCLKAREEWIAHVRVRDSAGIN